MTTPAKTTEATTDFLDACKNFFFTTNEKGATDTLCFDLNETMLLLGLLVVVLGSALWAASIASARRHNPFLNFLLGLILPVIYPLFILFSMNIPDAWSFEKEHTAKANEPQTNAAAAEADELEAVPAGELTFEATPAYFNKISRDDDGNPAGPWTCVFAGNTITVRQILDVMPNCINVEFTDARPEPRKMRILYEKIESFTPVAAEA